MEGELRDANERPTIPKARKSSPLHIFFSQEPNARCSHGAVSPCF
jgi:hypothetical protein